MLATPFLPNVLCMQHILYIQLDIFLLRLLCVRFPSRSLYT
uniref:Uncharacterized protein n=1 Tax=Setaria italica TaxID=4555 RepID=K4A3V5_SETIT